MRSGICIYLVAMAAIVVIGTDEAIAASPVYETKNVDVSAESVRCRVAGRPVLEGDVFSRRDFWKLGNYENRLGIEVGGTDNGVKGLCLKGPAKKSDTAWTATSGRIPLKGTGRRFILGFCVSSTVKIRIRRGDDKRWRGVVSWHGADGAEIGSEPIMYSAVERQRTEVSIYGSIPEGAAACSVRLGFDSPNIGPSDTVVYSGFVLEELGDAPEYAGEAVFVSKVHEGGMVDWRADVPDGCAVRFQWRGSSSIDGLSDVPFVGPDGTGGTFHVSPFTAGARYMQYRVTLLSNGRVTPALHEVRVGGRTDCGWTTMGDCRPPRVRRVSPSPTLNTSEPLCISLTDADSYVLWDSLRVTVDGKDMTVAFRRSGDVISLNAPPEGWAQGLHAAEVTVADFRGNKAKSRKVFYVGEAPKTPKVSLRDDGMTLVDGKPFFPIGLYAVCKREFNGYDLDVAFRGLNEAGFNMAHTYGDAYGPGFFASAKKYGIKLWVTARFPDQRFVDVGRHESSIIAWYLGDDTSDHILPALEADYDEAVKAVDPTRITVQADPILSSSDGLAQEEGSRYSEYVTATDGFMPEIYPVRGEPGEEGDRACVAMTIRDMKQFEWDVRLHGDGKPRTCWAIIQYFTGWGNAWRHFPTREQLFAMTFAAIIHGAHGVTWYTYGGFRQNEGVTSTPERWRNICELATRLSCLAPVLVERTPPQPSPPVVVSGPKRDPMGIGPSVTCLLKRHDGWCYLFAVNAAPECVSVKLAVEVEEAEPLEVLYENRSCVVSGGSIADDFAPFAVHVYKWRSSR